MAPEPTPENKAEKSLQFLIACIKHSSGGKVDWGSVVSELDIVTVGAAKKRFQRMMEPYGIGEKSLGAFAKKEKKGKKGKKEKEVVEGESEGKRGKKRKLVVGSMEDTVVLADRSE